MQCLMETREPGKKNCVRIKLGSIDYCGSVTGSGMGNMNDIIEETDRGAECLRIQNVHGFYIDHNEVETRLTPDKSLYEFRLDFKNSIRLTGGGAEMSVKEFLKGCTGSIDVIIDPQCTASDGWYPQQEAGGSNTRKLAPQFRSRGVGYIRLGDDMSMNGMAFISTDSCRSFCSSQPVGVVVKDEQVAYSTTTTSSRSGGRKGHSKRLFRNSAGNSNCSSSSSSSHRRQQQRGDDERSTKRMQTRSSSKQMIDRQSHKKALSRNMAHDSGDSEDEDDDDNDASSSSCSSSFLSCNQSPEPLENPSELLKQLQNVEITKDMKWKEKADLLHRLGKAIIASPMNGRAACEGALNYIQDIVCSKNVNVHVLRSSLQAVDDIGLSMGRELSLQVSWKTILIELLKLLKNKQVRGNAKDILRNLHGQCYTIGNSLTPISHVLGMGKNNHATNRKSLGASSGQIIPDKVKSNNVEVIEWLAETTELERSMEIIDPMVDEDGLSTLALYFLSHESHRDARCRKNALDGLLHTILFGIQRLDMSKDEAQSLCLDLKDSNPRAWNRLIKSVQIVLKEEKPSRSRRRSQVVVVLFKKLIFRICTNR